MHLQAPMQLLFVQKIDKELDEALKTLESEKDNALNDLDAQVCCKSLTCPSLQLTDVDAL